MASREKTFQSREKRTPRAKMGMDPIVINMLNIVDPTTVPVPMSASEPNDAINDVNNSGDDVPAAMNTAPFFFFFFFFF